jgi:division protein 1
MQVEDTLCLTGGSDGTIRLWDLRVVEDYEDRLKRESVNKAQQDPLERIAEQKAHDQEEDDDEDWEEGPSGYTDFTQSSQLEGQGPCVRVLEGHSKSVTSLYYEDGCLVSGHLVTGLGREQY